ncbi:MAG TPA: hypothetical protein VIC29_07965 [Steroidobacteraceae bacterium]
MVHIDSKAGPQLPPSVGQYLHDTGVPAAPQPAGSAERAHDERACDVVLPLRPVQALASEPAAGRLDATNV